MPNQANPTAEEVRDGNTYLKEGKTDPGEDIPVLKMALSAYLIP